MIACNFTLHYTASWSTRTQTAEYYTCKGLQQATEQPILTTYV